MPRLVLTIVPMTDGSHELKVGRISDEGGLLGGRYQVYILTKDQIEAWHKALPPGLEDLRAPLPQRPYIKDDIQEP